MKVPILAILIPNLFTADKSIVLTTRYKLKSLGKDAYWTIGVISKFSKYTKMQLMVHKFCKGTL